jgi:hypothetical protein
MTKAYINKHYFKSQLQINAKVRADQAYDPYFMGQQPLLPELLNDESKVDFIDNYLSNTDIVNIQEFSFPSLLQYEIEK